MANKLLSIDVPSVADVVAESQGLTLRPDQFSRFPRSSSFKRTQPQQDFGNTNELKLGRCNGRAGADACGEDDIKNSERAQDYDGFVKASSNKFAREELTTEPRPSTSANSGREEANNGDSSSGSLRPSPLGINKRRQEGNPVLKYIRNVPYEWSDTKADFELGSGACCLYLSLKWHKLHPTYIETRFKEVSANYALQVLLAVVNVDEPRHILRELNMFCFRAGWTLILSYSVEEAAEYLESFKLNERKLNDIVGEMTKKSNTIKNTQKTSVDLKIHKDKKQLCDAAINLLASVRSISRTDAQRLIGTFGSLKNIFQASVDQLCLCPGLGVQKAKRLHDAIRQQFLVNK